MKHAAVCQQSGVWILDLDFEMEIEGRAALLSENATEILMMLIRSRLQILSSPSEQSGDAMPRCLSQDAPKRSS